MARFGVWPRWVGSVAVAIAVWASPAAAQERFALLIGNTDYLHGSRLPNARNDAEAMAAALRPLGFEVEVAADLDEDAFEEALVDFGARADGADTALIFFAGHGFEISGENYLLPIDAELRRPRAERSEAVPLRDVLDAVSGATRLSVVILDACRNGPPGASRAGAGRGFVPAQADRPGLVVAFSTAPGDVAQDGFGDLSPYTQALTDALRAEPDIDVRFLFTSLGPAVQAHAGVPQEPFARFGRLPARQTPLGAPAEAALSAPPADDLGRSIESLFGGEARPASPDDAVLSDPCDAPNPPISCIFGGQ